MRRNRITEALQALGGAGTAQDITRIVRGRPECVSAQLSGMAQRGQVRKAGERTVRAARWHGGSVRVRAAVWTLC